MFKSITINIDTIWEIYDKNKWNLNYNWLSHLVYYNIMILHNCVDGIAFVIAFPLLLYDVWPHSVRSLWYHCELIIFVIVFGRDIGKPEMKIITFLLFTTLVSPAVNQYLTGKVEEKHVLEQRQLLLKDVFDCNRQTMLSLAKNPESVYHCLLGRIIHCDNRRRKSNQLIQLAQDKSRTYCTDIVHQGVITSHQHETVNIKLLHTFLINIEFLLFDFEWYSQVYHGLSVLEYMRDGGRNTTYYTGRRLPWTMITSNTAVMTISAFAHLKFQLHLFYSSTKWDWYLNVEGVYSGILSQLTYRLDLGLAFRKANHSLRKISYHFLHSDYKRIIISHDSIINSHARIVIFDGPGGRFPRLSNISFHRSTETTSFKTTTFHAYIEVHRLLFEDAEPSHIHFSPSVEFDYHECKIRNATHPQRRWWIRIFSKRFDDQKNTICYIPFKKTTPSVILYLSKYTIWWRRSFDLNDWLWHTKVPIWWSILLAKSK